MAKCIYCLKDEDLTSFNSKEHVIPKSLGRFTPLNPTIGGGIVCDNCNSLFSPLEANFLEDTLEGIFSQRIDIAERGSLIARDDNFKIERLSGFGESFLKEMFVFLEYKDGEYVPVLKNQIKLKRKSGGYRIFFPEALSSIKKGSKRFKKIAEDLRKLDQKDMAIFAENKKEVKECIELLHEFGVNYKEKNCHFTQMKPGDEVLIDEQYTCTLNKDIGRVIAKIAFNYFAYCAMQDGREDILYTEHFNDIRKYIHNGEGDGVRNFIPSLSEKPFLQNEKGEPKLIMGHLINFSSESRRIYAQINFFGLQPIYKINLGTLPPELNVINFGCGHAFNPFANTLCNLSQTEPSLLTEEQIRLSFGLLKRI